VAMGAFPFCRRVAAGSFRKVWRIGRHD
jgi:hypothetical protein